LLARPIIDIALAPIDFQLLAKCSRAIQPGFVAVTRRVDRHGRRPSTVDYILAYRAMAKL